MKTLALVTVLFAPLTVLAGYFVRPPHPLALQLHSEGLYRV